MTGSVLDRPASLFDKARLTPRTAAPCALPAPAFPAPPDFGGGVTLEARLDAAFHAARMEGSAKCPVCHARMSHTRAGARETAECGDCGTRLS
jgi:hypothetical protein